DAATGNLFVAEDFGLVRKVTLQGVVTTLVSNAGLNFQGSGVIAFDPAGKLYLADTYNHEIRVIMLDGSLSSVIGHPEQAGIALDPLPASLSMPSVVAVLPGGQLA